MTTELAYLLATYPSLKKSAEHEIKFLVQTWTDILADIDAKFVHEAVQDRIKNDDSKFPPSAGEIYKTAKALQQKFIDEQELARLQPPPENPADKCSYGLCKGKGAVWWYDDDGYELTYICPCHFEKRIRNRKMNEPWTQEKLIREQHKAEQYLPRVRAILAKQERNKQNA